MKNWTVEKRILLSFALVILAMIAVGAISLVQLSQMEDSAEVVKEDALPGIVVVGRILDTIWGNFSVSKQHVIAAESTGTGSHEAAISASWVELDQLHEAYAKTIHTEAGRALFEQYKALLVPYREAQKTFFGIGNASQSIVARDLVTLRLEPQFEAIRAKLYEIADHNDRVGLTKVAEIYDFIRNTRIGMALGYAAALILAIFSGYFLLRGITQPLARLVAAAESMRQGDFTQRVSLDRGDQFGALAKGFDRMIEELTHVVGQVQKSGIQVNASSAEIAASAKQQQATASEISATVTEIGATSKEISATSKELLRTVNDVATVAEDTANLAGHGQAGLARMEETMKSVMAASGSIGEKLATLNEKATNINHVVTTITKVADQTNLLSLNAAIEAEKAGEFGRGFSVVANEIRRLADQTAVATEDIETTVKEMQSAVSAGVMGMDKFSEEVRRAVREVQEVGTQLSQIITQVQTLTPRFEAVSEGMQAQSTGAQQISDALGQLSEAAKETAESLRQSSRVIDQLTEASNGLRNSVSRFKL